MTDAPQLWRLSGALFAQQHLERVAKRHNAHVGITGSVLRRETTKNANFIFYRANGRQPLDDIELLKALNNELDDAGFVYHFHFPEKRLSRSAQ